MDPEKYDYENKIPRISVLQEFSWSVAGSYLRFLKGTGENIEEVSKPFYRQFKRELDQMLMIDLFKLSIEELDNLLDYWKSVNELIEKFKSK